MNSILQTCIKEQNVIIILNQFIEVNKRILFLNLKIIVYVKIYYNYVTSRRIPLVGLYKYGYSF